LLTTFTLEVSMPAKKTATTPKAPAPSKVAAKKVVKPVPKAPAKVVVKPAPIVTAKKTVAKAPAKAVVKPAPIVAPKAPVKAAAKVAPKAAISGVFVRFERFSPHSGRVDLVGSFNGWELGKHTLVRDENGVWSIQIRLKPGTYEYKYVYDGLSYEPDPEREQVANPFGSANNLLIVT
jgi:hypothetical protein